MKQLNTKHANARSTNGGIDAIRYFREYTANGGTCTVAQDASVS